MLFWEFLPAYISKLLRPHLGTTLVVFNNNLHTYFAGYIQLQPKFELTCIKY